MFCVHCGAEMQPEHQFCGACGQAVRRAAAVPTQPPAPRQGTLEKHIPLLGGLWLLRGGLRLLGAAGFYLVGATFFPWMASMGRWSPDSFLAGLLPSLFTFGLLAHAAVALGSLAVGFGLMQREEWARPLALVMAFLALLSVPFGTALGIYTLFVLLPTQSQAEYQRLARAH
jgi:hypothetical protein